MISLCCHRFRHIRCHYSSFFFFFLRFLLFFRLSSFDSIINDFQVHSKVVKHLIWSFLRCHLSIFLFATCKLDGELNCDHRSQLYFCTHHFCRSHVFDVLYHKRCVCARCRQMQIFMLVDECTMHIHSRAFRFISLWCFSLSRSQCGNMLCHSIAIYIQYSVSVFVLSFLSYHTNDASAWRPRIFSTESLWFRMNHAILVVMLAVD